MELLLVSALHLYPVDVDGCINEWPLGIGTSRGLSRMLQRRPKIEEQRALLRMLQKVLGSGIRTIPMVCISAQACFWSSSR
jgi:hypothetical protein